MGKRLDEWRVRSWEKSPPTTPQEQALLVQSAGENPSHVVWLYFLPQTSQSDQGNGLSLKGTSGALRVCGGHVFSRCLQASCCSDVIAADTGVQGFKGERSPDPVTADKISPSSSRRIHHLIEDVLDV